MSAAAGQEELEELRRKQVAGRETLSMLMGVFEVARIAPRTPPSVTLPLTIISGFLGAGKTTLVNRLLTHPGKLKIAVLVNDFAAVNIDEELIRFRSDDVIGLTNGCACCSINGDLANAIQLITQRAELPDAVVLEASGLADPRGIAQVALAHPAMRLDAVVTLIDGETFPERLQDERTRPTLLAQLAAADIVALSKADLIAGRREAIRRLLGSTAPGRTVVEMTHGDIPLGVVLGTNSHVASSTIFSHADHVGGFASATRTWRRPLDREVTLRALRTLPAHVIRAKGIFCFIGDEGRRYIYQRVGTRDTLDVAVEPSPSEPVSRLVVIGFENEWHEAELLGALPVADETSGGGGLANA